MTLSALSSVSTVPDSSYQSGIQQRRSEFKQLAQALQSGDLGAAQSAYLALTQNAGSKTSRSNPNSPLAQDFAALGQSLQSGDLTGAQQAFAKLQQDAASVSASGPQSAAGGAHRVHRHHDVDSDGAASSSGASSATAPTSSTNGSQSNGSTAGTVINVTA